MPVPITPEGVRRLQEELEQLWKVERPRVTREVAAAAAQGDRSENAEYIYGKRRLREIDSRVRFLRKRFDELQVIGPQDIQDRECVYFGAWVTLEDEQGNELCYRLVGPDETRPEAGLISIRSPIGRALVGRRRDDEVRVERPAGRTLLRVIAIEYGKDAG